MKKAITLIAIFTGLLVFTSCSKDEECVCTTTSSVTATFEESEGTGLSAVECDAHDASNALAVKDCELK
jgi:hypothetical protein